MTNLKISQQEGILSSLLDNSYSNSQTKKILEMQGKKEEFTKKHYFSPQVNQERLDHWSRSNNKGPTIIAHHE